MRSQSEQPFQRMDVEIVARCADLLITVSFPIILLVPFDQFVFRRYVIFDQKPASLASE